MSAANPIPPCVLIAEGDPWVGSVKPKIRLMGRWLERAGFKPGERVRVTHIAPGVIELRSQDATPVEEQQPDNQSCQ